VLNSYRTLLAVMISLTLSPGMVVAGAERIMVVVDREVSPRVRFGAERLNQALAQVGYDASVVSPTAQAGDGQRIILRIARDPDRQGQWNSEGYRLRREEQNVCRVTAFGDSGMLYGCLELAERVAEFGALPQGSWAITTLPILTCAREFLRMRITSRIEGSELIRRYLQHVLPRGFHTVRYYGIWHKSNDNHVSTLANSMILDAIMSGRPIRQSENEDSRVTDKTLRCPHCGSDQLVLLEQLPRPRSRSP